MEFYILKAESPEEAETIWTATRDLLRSNGFAVTDRRIYATSSSLRRSQRR